MRHPITKALLLIFSAAAAVMAFLLFALCALCLNAGLYHSTPGQIMDTALSRRAELLAVNLANKQANESYCTLPEEVLMIAAGDQYDDESISQRTELPVGTWSYTIAISDGGILASTAPEDTASLQAYTFHISGCYYAQSNDGNDIVAYVEYGGQQWHLRYEVSHPYTVTVYLDSSAIHSIYGVSVATMNTLYAHRYTLIVLTVVCVLLYGLFISLLCCGAGKRRKEDPSTPKALNRIPLDLYLAAAGVLCAVSGGLALDVVYDMGYFSTVNQVDPALTLHLILASGSAFLAALPVSGFLFALAAQWKVPGLFWLRNTLIFRLLRLSGRLLSKLAALGLRGLRYVLELFRLLPLMGQWLLTGFAMLLWMFVSFMICDQIRKPTPLILATLVNLGVVIYGGWAFGVLLKGARQMAQGHLNTQVPEKYLIGVFKTFAQQLNALSRVTAQATDARLRSERMKAELITNVSHDIKTPLTSIINYIDLLPRADEAQRQEYLQILDRQSQRLKRLIEDLTEMSRASTGNIHTDIRPMDGVEALTQALGEFSDKFSSAGLQVCTTLPEQPVMILSDGRLFWRVMSNLLGNVVKYAMPGTRVYVELKCLPGIARLSIKNISREPLNLSASELMERFVRGDSSRNTEGSGLGLSIAGSLMEVQKGRLLVFTDADLFTAAMEYPLAGQ